MSRQLKIYQSLWAMELRDERVPERTMEQAFEMVSSAGFHGMGMDLGERDIEKAYRAKPLFERHGLGCLFNAFPTSVEMMRPMLHIAKEFGCEFLNVIGQVMPIRLEEMIPVVRRWIEMSQKAGMPIQFETHRNSITNDLFSTLQLLDAVPEMRLCADLSHIMVDREFQYPLASHELELISRILARCDSFQGRVASNQQIQVPVSFPHNAKWFDLFADWWEEGFRSWKARSGPDSSVIFLCELGPPEYAIRGADGHELSDRWDESLIIRDRARAIWETVAA